jgi:hypothetical protein
MRVVAENRNGTAGTDKKPVWVDRLTCRKKP